MDVGTNILPPTTYPIGDRSLKFGKLMSEMSFIAIEDVVLFVCVLNTDKRPIKTHITYGQINYISN